MHEDLKTSHWHQWLRYLAWRPLVPWTRLTIKKVSNYNIIRFPYGKTKRCCLKVLPMHNADLPDLCPKFTIESFMNFELVKMHLRKEFLILVFSYLI